MAEIYNKSRNEDRNFVSLASDAQYMTFIGGIDKSTHRVPPRLEQSGERNYRHDGPQCGHLQNCIANIRGLDLHFSNGLG